MHAIAKTVSFLTALVVLALGLQSLVLSDRSDLPSAPASRDALVAEQHASRFIDEGRERDLPEFVPDRLIVRFDNSSSAKQRAAVRKKFDLRRISSLPLDGMEVASVPRGSDEKALAKTISGESAVAYAQTDNYVQVTSTPNDPSFANLWGLHNTGQTVNTTTGTADSDIDAPEAWELFSGSDATNVAVVDTGVDYDHEDLDANIWSNPGETGGGKETNGVDDDGNGLIDDFRGWDFAGETYAVPNSDNDPDDVHSHGTHVAGTIGAEGNNGTGITGVNWDASIVPVKGLDDEGYGTDSTLVPALMYAGQHAKVVNGSFGGGGYSQASRDAIHANPQTLYVFAAGNSNFNVDNQPFYPCSYDEPNVVCVAATTATDDRSSFSNYGATEVDLGAPGSNILSTVPDDGYTYLNGTSMASPHVAGAASLMRSYEQSASAAEIKSALLESTDSVAALAGKTVSGGRLNVAKAIETLRPADGTAVVQTGNGRLTFTAGNDSSNDVDVSLSGGTYSVVDTGATLVAGTGCTSVNSHEASCSASGVDELRVRTGDLADEITSSAGTDTTVFAGPGDDAIATGSGDDRLDGGTGNDVVDGGAGLDTADYSSRMAGVSVSLDGIANDGESGETDDVGTDVENISGGVGNDSLTGNNAANTLTGSNGADTLDAGGGDDILVPGLGTDSVDGGSGSDTVEYSDRTASVTVSLDATANDGEDGENDALAGDIENLVGGDGDDTLIGSSGVNQLDGGAGNDRIRSGAAADVSIGGAGVDIADYTDRSAAVTVSIDGSSNDGESGEGDNVGLDVESIDGGSGDDTLTGSSANNTFNGGAGSDEFVGLAGSDTVTYISRSAALSASIDGNANDGESGEADDVGTDIENLTGGAGNDALSGDNNANALSGSGGNDSLAGNDGDDTLDGGYGDDEFNGGAGTDTATYASRLDFDAAVNGLDGGVGVSIDGVADDGYGTEADNVKLDVENVTGTVYSDHLEGSAGDNRLDGSDSGDILVGGDGNDELIGGPADEAIFPISGANNEIDPGNGDDYVDTGALYVELVADPGSDTYYSNGLSGAQLSYEARTASINASIDNTANDGESGEGDDIRGSWAVVKGGSGDDTIKAAIGGGILAQLGGPGNDTLTGGGGWTYLHGDDGSDQLNVGAGISFQSGFSAYWGGSGTDTISYAARSSAVTVSPDGYGNDGADGENHYVATDVENIVGTDQDDTLIGNNSDNKLDGGYGCDSLTGNDGNDELVGGPSDEEYFGACVNTYAGGNGNDTLRSAGSDEVLLAEPGSDTYYSSSNGTTTVDYSSKSAAVNVSIDNVANDGTTGENDNVRSGIQTVKATDHDDTLVGSNGINVFLGGDGDDTLEGKLSGDFLYGEAGDDTLDGGVPGGQWTDALYGGTGSDTVTYATRTESVTVNLAAGGSNGEAGEDDYLAGDVENAIGGEGFDTLVGNSADNKLEGGYWCDSLTGNGGNDTLYGGPTDEDNWGMCVNTYSGGEGNDTIRAVTGGEELLAEPGADTYYGGSATVDYSARGEAVNVSIDNVANDGASGENDNVKSGIQTVKATDYDDTLVGNNGINVFLGGDGDDTMDGKLSGDFLYGEDGNDLIDGGPPGGSWTDALYGGSGVDTVTYAGRTASVTVSLAPGSSNGESGENDYHPGDIENVIGGSGADTLTGNGSANVITGGGGADSVDGAGGDDEIRMQDGVDDSSIVCGGGTDSVLADLLPFDVTDPDCESVTRS